MRTRIALDPEDHARAKYKAARLGITLEEYIHRLVAPDLGSVALKPTRPASSGSAGQRPSDIAEERKATIVAKAIPAHQPRR
ncbi:MAG TPA: hypothetical protein VE569_03710 [Acidimicrobiia bacterium]|nr:hypothetical protein [Acidimicrobiia bacterium]